MRLWVRSKVQLHLFFVFSRAVGSASDTSNEKVLYQLIDPIAKQSDSRDKDCHEEKTNSFVCIVFVSQRFAVDVFADQSNPLQKRCEECGSHR